MTSQGSQEEVQDRYLMAMSLTALGIVFGDIGTSPIYALRESFPGELRGERTHVRHDADQLLPLQRNFRRTREGRNGDVAAAALRPHVSELSSAHGLLRDSPEPSGGTRDAGAVVATVQRTGLMT